MGDLVYRQGPSGYVPSGEPRGASAEERMAALRGMLPAGEEWLLELIRSVLQGRQAPPPAMPGLGQESEQESRKKKFPRGMLPLPGGIRS